LINSRNDFSSSLSKGRLKKGFNVLRMPSHVS
jgi:hypothetical protein